MPSANWRSPELLAWLFNESAVRDDVVVNDRWGEETRHKHGGYYTTEYTAGLETGAHPWEESRGMAHSYGYNRMERVDDYHSDRELILMLVDLVSRGGNLLLDIGPTADGRIPVIMEERLAQIGQWLDINGEAIYGTRPWRRTRQWSGGDKPEMKTGTYMIRYDVTDFVDRKKPGQAVIEAFFTAKGDAVYAILPCPTDGRLVLKDVLPGAGATVALLGHPGALQWRREGKGIAIDLPAAANAQHARTLKLTGILPR
jgi:alpha-L-fucosidase